MTSAKFSVGVNPKFDDYCKNCGPRGRLKWFKFLLDQFLGQLIKRPVNKKSWLNKLESRK